VAAGDCGIDPARNFFGPSRVDPLQYRSGHIRCTVAAEQYLVSVAFGALATSVLTPIESPIRDFLRSHPVCVAYAERMRTRFFPELAAAAAQQRAA
jgi:hypothetical protein